MDLVSSHSTSCGSMLLYADEFSLVQNFDPIPPLINHALSEVMRCNPAEHPVLVTGAPWNTQANRERMAEIMFEEFQAPAFYIANTGVLNAYVVTYYSESRHLTFRTLALPQERAQHWLLILESRRRA